MAEFRQWFSLAQSGTVDTIEVLPQEHSPCVIEAFGVSVDSSMDAGDGAKLEIEGDDVAEVVKASNNRTEIYRDIYVNPDARVRVVPTGAGESGAVSWWITVRYL